MAKAHKRDQISVEKLLENLQSVVADAEALLKATAHQAGEKVQEARAKAQESIEAARERLSEMKDSAFEKGRELIDDGDEYVRSNPWQAVGIAAGVGLLVGFLISMKRR